MVTVESLVKKLEEVYQTEKNKECEELYAAMATILNEKKPTVQNVLYVLELIKFSVLKDKLEEVMGKDAPRVEPK